MKIKYENIEWNNVIAIHNASRFDGCCHQNSLKLQERCSCENVLKQML